MRLRIEALEKRFEGKPAVRDLDLGVEDGEFVVILGPSGCGKTTTLRLLAGFETADAGSITIGDRVVSDPTSRLFVPPQDRSLGMVFQSYAIWPHMTVYENVAYPLRVRRIRRAETRAKVTKVLEQVGLVDEIDRPATALSGGQMQRVALARALVYEPAVLLLDEPLSNLDAKMRERLRGELKSIQQATGVTSVYVTHDQTEAMELGDRIAVMRDGVLQQFASPAELWHTPQTAFVADFVGGANIVPVKVVDDERDEDGAFRVRTPGGAVVEVAGQPPAESSDLSLVLRPEDVELVATEGPPGANCWPVSVVHELFQGGATRYTVQWDDTEVRVLSQGHARTATPAEQAYLRVDPHRVTVVPR